MKCEIIHLDTCLSDYFQGFDGTVFAVPVDNNSTNSDVINGINDDAQNSCYFNEDQEWGAFAQALTDLKKDLADRKKLEIQFDSRLEPSSEDHDSVYAYFGVKFDSDD